MDPNAPIRYSDLIQPDNSIEELKRQLKELADQYKTVTDGIKAQANSVKSSLDSLSGATSQGQQGIKNASSIVDKLAKKEVELAQSTSETAKRLAEINTQLRYNNNMMKLQVKLAKDNNKEFDIQNASYDQLSAKYSINKMQLNAMTQEERKATEAGQALEAETAAIYQKMKQLQEVTGKHTLSVGDYGIATANLASDIRNGIQALTQMRIEMKLLEKEGQRGSERWTELSENSQRLAKDLKGLKREYQIVKLETNALGQQTGYLNDAIGVLSTGAGGLSAATGLMNMFGMNTSGAAQALVELNSAMAIANGLSQVYNGIFKSGNLLLLARTVQTKAATAAQNLQTKSTIAAKVAQAALNVVAKANPYLLLAAAIAALVGILIGWVSANANLIKQQKLLNQQEAARLDYLEAYAEEGTRIYKENQKALEQELTIAQARKAGYAETQKIENQIQATKEKNNAASKAYYEEEIKNLGANRTELKRLRDELLKAQSVRSNRRVEIQLDAEGPARKIRASKVVDIIQEKINNLNKKVQIATELIYDDQQLKADAEALLEQHRQQALEVAALERSALRSAEDVQLALLHDRFNREREMEKANIARQIVDLKVRLQTENNLTLAARKAINGQIINLQRQLVKNLEDINNREREANIAAIRDFEDARLNARQDTAEKQREVLRIEYERDIEDLEFRLATEEDLTITEIDSLTQQLSARWARYQKDRFNLENKLRQDALNKEAEAINNQLVLVSENTNRARELRLRAIENQRQAELAANKSLAIDMRQDEADINAKYDQMAKEEEVRSANELAQAKLEVDQKYEESVFNLKMHSEDQITRFQLMQQKKRLETELKAQQRLLSVQTGEQKAMTQRTIKTIQNQIVVIDREIRKGASVSNIWELFGFNSDAARAIQTVMEQVVSSLKEFTSAWLEAANAARNSADAAVSAAEKMFEAENEARRQGYASHEEYARKELVLARRQQRAAIEEQRKAQQAQEALDTLSQASSLVTASANLWKTLSVLSPAAAIAGIALMWGSFAAAKIKAAEITKPVKYGEGTVELLQGGSHASGHDIDLGTRKDGTPRRAEGGEFFAIINKRNSRKYRGIIPDVIHSLNNGTFVQKYMKAYDNLGNFALAASSGNFTDVSQLERDVEAIKKQNDTKIYVDAKGNTIFVHKNYTKKLKS